MSFYPYLQFNGNCAEAIKFYQKAFGVKAEIYKEDNGLVSHAELVFGDGWLGLSDTPKGEKKSSFGNGGISISVCLESVKELKSVFKKLSADGKVWQKPEANASNGSADWCECFCTFEDKFGVNWSLMSG